MTYYACNIHNKKLRIYRLVVKYRDTSQTVNMLTPLPEYFKEGFLTFVFACIISKAFFYVYCYFFDLTYVFLFSFFL